MTDLSLEFTTCDNCGATETVVVIGSSISFSHNMDLDSRPRDLDPELFFFEVNHCRNCGYCAPDIGAGTTAPASILESPQYRSVLADQDLPTSARKFRCAALIAEAEARFARAGWFHLKGAWICDDEGDHEGASRFRDDALSSWADAKLHAQAIGVDHSQERLIVVDVTRRAGRFEEALALTEDFPEDEGFLAELMRLQIRLIGAKDATCHTFRGAMGKQPRWS